MHKTNESKTANSKIQAASQSRFSVMLFAAVLAAPLCLSPQLQATGQPSSPPGAWQSDLGNGNTADGNGALDHLTTGLNNTAIGYSALFSDTTSSLNTAIGYSALYNSNSDGNTAAGYNALYSNTTGSVNTAVGTNALQDNTIGSYNIALGFDAGDLLTTGDYNIDIGNSGVAGEANTIRIGNPGYQVTTYIAGISGTAVIGTAVVVNGDGQLGVAPSSERFKTDIKSMGKSSEAIFGLKPVSFRYTQEIDPKRLPQFGLVAEEVEKVDPDLVARDRAGHAYTVRYEAVNAMLLNEFLKQHRRVEAQETKIAQQDEIFRETVTKFQTVIARQQKQIDSLTANLKQQTSQIQRVSAQLQLEKPEPRIVHD